MTPEKLLQEVIKYTLNQDSNIESKEMNLIKEAQKLACNMEGIERSKRPLRGLNTIFSEIELPPLEEKSKTENDKPDLNDFSWPLVNIDSYPYPSKTKSEGKDKLPDDIEELICSPVENIENRLLLLEKHCSTTAADLDRSVSLYQLIRTTASIGYSLYLHSQRKEHNPDTPEAPFSLIHGDLSGIQKFIYTISSKGMLKTVRARSFFLDLVIESACSQLCRQMNLPRYSVIYASGGSFFILAPNANQETRDVPLPTTTRKTHCEYKKPLKDKDLTKENSSVRQFRNYFNKYLLDEFDGALFLCIDSINLYKEDFMTEGDRLPAICRAWGEVRFRSNLQKGRKWNKEIGRDDFFAPSNTERECNICHSYKGPIEETEEGLSICAFCENMIHLGSLLASPDRSDSFYETSQECFFKESSKIKFKIGSCYYLFKEKPEEIITEYRMNDPWSISEERHSVIPYPVGRFSPESEFTKLAEKATGDKKIGVLRMDVDRLGQTFSQGIKRATFCRLNELSWRMNLYFKYYLPHLLKEKGKNSFLPYCDDKKDMVIVYAGGDDLFLVGSWNSSLESAWEIKEDFAQYCCHNKSITISGGTVVSSPKHALYRLADLAGEAESQAKDNGRQSFTFAPKPMRSKSDEELRLGWSFSWQDMEGLRSTMFEKKDSESLSGMFSLIFEKDKETGKINLSPSCGVSHSTLYRLDKIIERFNKEGQKEKPWFFPSLYYMMARKDIKREKPFFNRLRNIYGTTSLDDNKSHKYLPMALAITKLLLRGEVEDE